MIIDNAEVKKVMKCFGPLFIGYHFLCLNRTNEIKVKIELEKTYAITDSNLTSQELICKFCVNVNALKKYYVFNSWL